MKNDLLSDGERMLVEAFRQRIVNSEINLNNLRAQKRHLFQLMDKMIPGANDYVNKALRQDLQVLDILDKYLPADPPEEERKRAAR